jgi:uncharacterized membrane protein
VQLETVEQMRSHAPQIEILVRSKTMPPGNATNLTDEERVVLVAWAAAQG